MRIVRPKVVLVNVDEVIRNFVVNFVDIFAPLGESPHFWCHICVFSAFCFGNDYTPICEFHCKIRVVVGNIAIGVDIIKPEIYREVVLGVGKDIGAVFQESGEVSLKLIIARDSVEHGLFRHYVPLVFDHEGARTSQLDSIANLCVTLVPYCEVVNRSLEGIEYGFCCRNL